MKLVARFFVGFISLVLTLTPLAHGVGFYGFTYKGLDEPIPTTLVGRLSLVEEKWISQPLDHFNHRDNRTWLMRYYEAETFFNGTGPILIMLGGEWEISTGFLRAGLMYDIALEYGAMMYYTEHRYYGKSKPTNNASEENLQYLNVDQALADVAYFIEMKKNELGLKNSPVIVFGGSYAGNMAAWARTKYPHLIQGALASSAPVYAKADFYEYYQVVQRSLGRYEEQCVTDIKQAFKTVQDLLQHESGRQKLENLFNLCTALNVDSENEVSLFMGTLASMFAGIVQYNKHDTPEHSSISQICDVMTSKSLGSPVERLASCFESTSCNDFNYKSYIERMRNELWHSQPLADTERLWTYQTCAEYGYYQTSDSKQSIFGDLFPLRFFIATCMDVFGNSYNEDFLNSRVQRTNILYGGDEPDVTNVIFSNGDIDPWHSLSILEDLSESTPALLIQGSSHCMDLYPNQPADHEELREARQKIRKIISKWLST